MFNSVPLTSGMVTREAILNSMIGTVNGRDTEEQAQLLCASSVAGLPPALSFHLAR